MKVLLINGSPNKNGCTYTALSEVVGALEAAGVEAEFFHLGTKPMQGCTGCRKCGQLGRCVFDDAANEVVGLMKKADGLVIGSPVYYAGPNGALCALLDRVFFSSGTHAHMPAAAVVSCRRAGATAALDRLHKYLTIGQMPLVTSRYWPMVHGSTPAQVRQDEEGMQVMRTLGKNMAWMLESIRAGNVPPPAPEEKRMRTDFIRD